MVKKALVGTLPCLVAGLGAGSVHSGTSEPDEGELVAKASLVDRISVVREHFQSNSKVEITGDGGTLAWYNWNNGFDNWNNGPTR